MIEPEAGETTAGETAAVVLQCSQETQFTVQQQNPTTKFNISSAIPKQHCVPALTSGHFLTYKAYSSTLDHWLGRGFKSTYFQVDVSNKTKKVLFPKMSSVAMIIAILHAVKLLHLEKMYFPGDLSNPANLAYKVTDSKTKTGGGVTVTKERKYEVLFLPAELGSSSSQVQGLWEKYADEDKKTHQWMDRLLIQELINNLFLKLPDGTPRDVDMCYGLSRFKHFLNQYTNFDLTEDRLIDSLILCDWRKCNNTLTGQHARQRHLTNLAEADTTLMWEKNIPPHGALHDFHARDQYPNNKQGLLLFVGHIFTHLHEKLNPTDPFYSCKHQTKALIEIFEKNLESYILNKRL